jgi:O-antigen/teichoic acid export membrane protein
MTPQAGNSQTVARNSFWYSLEMAGALVAAFITSIVTANIIGPERLSYFNYMVWLTNVTTLVGAFGLPVTTRKYMAEYINRGEEGVARTTYLLTLRFQTMIAAGVTLAVLALVLLTGNPDYRLISVLLVVSMAPRMVGCIPSQANNANETMKRNTLPSMVASVLQTAITLFSLWVGWGLLGVAAAVPICGSIECAWKLLDVERWLRAPRSAMPPDLKHRMLSYSGQGLALMLLNILVWDRSDMIFLKAMNSDVRQVTFFSLAFNLTERVLMIPKAFGSSLGVTMMAQFGRGQSKLQELTISGARYALLVSLPLLVGMACLAGPMVLLLYREPYRPLIPTLMVVSLLAIPKALSAIPTQLLQATERQGFLILWGCICGAVNIVLDILLVPGYGAIGAALANGLAQLLAAIGTWIFVWRVMRLDLRLKDFGRIFASGAVMAAGVVAINRSLPGYLGMAASIAAGAVIWAAALRLFRVLDGNDANRFRSVGRVLPASARPIWNRFIHLLVPATADSGA